MMDNLDRMRDETDKSYEGTKTAMGITGMVVLTAAVIIVLAIIAIWVI
jgi:hypothetical protein